MDSIISQLITEWGTLGLLLGLIIWIVIDSWKNSKKNNLSGVINEIKLVSGDIKTVSGKVDNLEEKINIVNTKVDDVDDKFDRRIDGIEDKVNNLPQLHIEELIMYNKKNQSIHTKEMLDLLRLGPKLHDTLREYNESIHSDHIFIGSFHNGNKSITGIPYYKFDIIAERFGEQKVEQDCEFAYMYKDSDILRFDKLPALLVQQEILHFEVPETGDTKLSENDDIIWRRMRGRGIRQIALHILKDKSNTPSGFVGVVRYDSDPMNLKELHMCARQLESNYHEAENNNQ